MRWLTERRVAGTLVLALAVIALAPTVAFAKAPSHANIRFKVPGAVSSPALDGTATIPGIVYWDAGRER